MSRQLSSLHARIICHATESEAKVEQALRTVVGDSEVGLSRTEGHFGNAIVVMESKLSDEVDILDVIHRMSAEDRVRVASTLATRTDDDCNVFVRFDKQSAYAGHLRLVEGEDVVAVRIKVRAFPAKREAAAATMERIMLGSDGTREGK